MHGYGYSFGSVPDWFPDSAHPEQELADARKARENSPDKVLGDMAAVVGTSLAIVLLIDAALFLASGPMQMIHLG